MATTGEFVFRDQLSVMAKERLEPSEIGEMIKLTIENDAISFTAGEPSPDIYPLDELKESFKDVFNETSLLAYYKDDFGLIELREWIADRMAVDGIAPEWVSKDNILLTNGAGEAIQLVSEALIDPGSIVLVESPTYTESLLTFRKQGAQCISVPSDDNGIVPEALEDVLSKRRVRFLYTIPNFQNPSGRTSPKKEGKRYYGSLKIIMFRYWKTTHITTLVTTEYPLTHTLNLQEKIKELYIPTVFLKRSLRECAAVGR